MSQAFEEKIRQDLRGYLLLKNEIGVRFPQAVDIEEKWLPIAQSYIPDGAREFRNYPSASRLDDVFRYGCGPALGGRLGSVWPFG